MIISTLAAFTTTKSRKNQHPAGDSVRWDVYSKTELFGLTLIVPSANSVSPLKIAVANRLIHTIHKNCIVYLFL